MTQGTGESVPARHGKVTPMARLLILACAIAGFAAAIAPLPAAAGGDMANDAAMAAGLPGDPAGQPREFRRNRSACFVFGANRYCEERVRVVGLRTEPRQIRRTALRSRAGRCFHFGGNAYCEPRRARLAYAAVASRPPVRACFVFLDRRYCE